MAAADGLDERRPVVIAGIAWDVLVLVVMVYLAFADPLAIGMLQHFAIPALDVFATVVLVIDVPRQALAIVLAHRRELVENANAAKLERRSAKEDDVDEEAKPSQQWGVLAVGLTVSLWPAVLSASASLVLDVMLLGDSTVSFGWFAALRCGRLWKCTTWSTSVHSLWRGLTALVTGGEPTSFQLEQLSLQYDAVISLLNLGVVVVLAAHALSCAWGSFYYEAELPITDASLLKRYYLLSFYWAVTTISTVGYGDITPSNSDERWLIIVAEVCAVSVFGCIIGVVTTLLKQLNRERMLRDEIMDGITNFMLEHKLGIRLQERVHAHFDYYYRQRSIFNTQQLLEDLPPTLRLALMERLCGDFFNPAFGGSFMDVAVDVKFVLANAFVPFHLYTNEVLTYEGELSLDLFFITAGRLQRYKGTEPHDELTEGRHIGEVYDKEYLFSYSIVALEPSRLFSVPHATVRQLWARFGSHLPPALRVEKAVEPVRSESRTTDAKAAWKRASAIKRGMAFKSSLKVLRAELSSTEHGWQDTLAADGVPPAMRARPTQSAWLRAEIRDAFAARCIHPKARLKAAYDVLLALAIVYSMFTAPLWFALRVRDAQLPAALLAIDAAVDVLFVLEVPVNFRTVHLDAAHGTPILDTRQLARRYVRTWFVPDLVAALPLAHIDRMRGYGLFRLFKFPKALGLVQQHGSVLMHPAWLTILKLIMFLFSVAHVAACMWLAVPAWATDTVDEAPNHIYPHEDFPLSRWETAVFNGTDETTCAAPVCMVGGAGAPPCVVSPLGLDVLALEAATNVSMSGTYSAASNWFWRYGSQCERPWANYQIALMWSLTTLTTVGYGDVCPDENSPAELLVAIVVMLLGSTIFAVVISNFTELMSKFNMHQKVVKDKMHEVDAFVRSAGLDREIASEIHGFFSYKMSSSVSHILDGQNSVMSKLSPPLRHAVLRNMLIHEASPVMRCPLFSGLEDEIVMSTVHMMEALFLVPNNVLFKQGEPGFHMYFLIDGVVDIESGDGLNVYATRVSGEYFGEVALTVSTGRTATARAKTFSSLYSLSKERFQIILDLYPEAQQNVYNEANKRLSHVTKSSSDDNTPRTVKEDKPKPRSTDGGAGEAASVEHSIMEHQGTMLHTFLRGKSAHKKMKLAASFGSCGAGLQVSAEALACQAESSAMQGMLFNASRAADDAIAEVTNEQSAATLIQDATAQLRHELDAKTGECEELREQLAKAQEALKEAEATATKPSDDGGSLGAGGALAC